MLIACPLKPCSPIFAFICHDISNGTQNDKLISVINIFILAEHELIDVRNKLFIYRRIINILMLFIYNMKIVGLKLYLCIHHWHRAEIYAHRYYYVGR
mgnify:CR=1 FL=1